MPAVRCVQSQSKICNLKSFSSILPYSCPSLQSAIERLATLGEVERNPEARQTFFKFREQLTQGKIRAAEKINGQWTVNAWVKQGILLGFRLGELSQMGGTATPFPSSTRTLFRRDILRWPTGCASFPADRQCGKAPSSPLR